MLYSCTHMATVGVNEFKAKMLLYSTCLYGLLVLAFICLKL